MPRLDVTDHGFTVEFDSVEAVGDGAPRSHGHADPADAIRAWSRGESLVPLLEGGWAPLPSDWLDRFGHRIADLLAARDDSGELPVCCLPDLAGLCHELDQPVPPDLARLGAGWRASTASLARTFRGTSPANCGRTSNKASTG